MQAEIVNMISSSSQLEVKIEHKTEELRFSISSFGRDSFKQGFGLFDHSNAWWASMREEEQDYVFDLYKQIRKIFDTAFNRNTLVSQLSQSVSALIRFHALDKAEHWLTFQSPVIIPEKNFAVEYISSYDKQGSREQTYIRREYVELITLALVLRTMVPIWGEFISQTRKETGTQFKEYYAFQLLNASGIIDSPAMHRLRTYIDYNIGDERANPTNIVDGISAEDFPSWMLGLVVIRRLCIGDIRGVEQDAHIVSYIYKFITSRTRTNDSSDDSVVKIKKTDKSSTGRDTLSSLERYKIKHSISMGEIVELEHSLRDMRNIAFRLSGQMTEELYRQGMASAEKLENIPLLEPQITLLRWVFKPIISPQGLVYMEKSILTKALGVLEAVLWARGHYVLSLAATSYAVMSESEMFVSSDNPRARVPKELSAELDALYPYMVVSGGAKTGQKLNNLAAISIDNLTNNLSMYSWTIAAHEDKIRQVFGHVNSRRLSLPSDIKAQITKLVIELAKRNWK